MHTGTGLASYPSARLDELRFRPLRRAVLCSLVLHALLLFCLSYFREGGPIRAPAPPPLSARLAKPSPPPEPPHVEPLPPRPAAAARASPRPAPEPVPAAPAPSAESARQAAEPAPAVPAAPPAQLSVAKSDVQAAPLAASGPDPGSVARFRLELMEIARRYKRYPRIAQDNNFEGRVELRIAIGEDGTISSLTVKKSAGHAVLDDEAQAMIRVAKSRAAIPSALRGKAFSLEISVDFFLKDEVR